MIDFTDSIAAIATAPGRGGIAIIRISGPDALSVAQSLITKRSTNNDAKDEQKSALSERQSSSYDLKPRYAYFKKFYDGDEVVDEGVLLYFKAPYSYTGEDVIELQGHGGNVVPQRLLSTVLKHKNVRQAEPGEFTRRAFLNGRMDLTAAEAVEDLISAGSESAAKAAMASLNGAFAERLNSLTERLTTLRVRIEACLDFPEEHEDFFDSGRAASEIDDLIKDAQEARTIANQGLKLNEGARIVLAGRPNAGKSSLLNALAGAERAIVTNIPGTTRDVLTVNIEIGGIPVTITDTAGIRDEPSDEIEAIGIRRALDELKQADLILLMVDSSKEASDAVDTLNHINTMFDNPQNILVVKSKQDLEPNAQTAALLSSAPLNQYPQVPTSTKQEGGLDELRNKLTEILGIIPSEGVFSARRRHLGELEETYEAILRARELIDFGDLVLTARELTIAQNHLGTITGKITSDDLLGKIFSTFCIGK